MGRIGTPLPSEFSIVLACVSDSQTQRTMGEFSRAFGLEEKIAEQIIKSAPIVFLHRLTKDDVRTIKPKLLELSRLGLEFRITARPQPGIPKVNWPMQPRFASAPDGSVVSSVSYEWDNTAFVCPSCGETFLFRRLGKTIAVVEASAANLEEPAAARDVAERGEEEPAPAAKASRRARSTPKQQALPSEIESLDVDFLAEPTAATPGRRRSSSPEIPVRHQVRDLSEEAQEIAEPPEDLEALPITDEAPGATPDLAEPIEDMEIIPLDEALAEVEEVTVPAKKPGKPTGAPVAREAQRATGPRDSGLRRQAAAGRREPEPEEEEDERIASVFLTRIHSPEQREAAARMISDIRGVSLREAKELANRVVIPVLKDVTMEEAEACLERFKKIKCIGRVTTRSK